MERKTRDIGLISKNKTSFPTNTYLRIRMPRIAFVEPVGGHGGNEFYDFGLCQSLTDVGCEMVLYTCDKTSLDLRHQFSFSVVKTYIKIFGSDSFLVRGFRYLFASIRSALDARKRELRIAHFHIYHFSIVEVINVLAFRMAGLKCLATIHDVESFDKYETKNEKSVTPNARIILRLCERFLVHSELAQQTLLTLGVDEAVIRLVPHGDTDFLYGVNKVPPLDARRKLGLPETGILLLFFGQIKAVKGLDVLLEAMPSVRADVHLLVVGKCWKQDLDDYLTLISALGLSNRVTFRNSYIPNEDVPLYFWSCDAICLPYKKIYSSGVVLRAMDYQCPVVCSDLSPLARVIQDGATGLLFTTGDPKSLADKLNRICDDEQLRLQIQTRAKAYIDEHYSWPIVATATKRVYEELA